MHTQPLFSVEARHELLRLMSAYPLATLVTVADGAAEANLLPLEVCDIGVHGTLRGHVARSHALFTGVPDGSRVTAVFQSPNAYISPRWYVNGQRSGRLAPSWNYAAVQAQGVLRFVDDPAWVLAHLASLTASQEAGRAEPWSLDDASQEFVQDASQRLVGFEIDIQSLTGKRFLSQQRTEADRRSLIEHLALENAPSARAVASLIVP
ncbi:FMN-binding negative transcriptional regulator [Variovorax sp. ZS18.2.2]|uniref:FMN-binding negative transcriptional regulator n=1 Tax=Variovorax sp. ZS18.2.2 TaxID=2971255 RepID=UPI0021513E1E|nr:FMN-binding negative transcriptional regulator [Variovorax sp. ZS18.2.2]MCR6478736.1 FMN-binding negative transcriptional regulator [Variovorax sp. ZS18.2.2]